MINLKKKTYNKSSICFITNTARKDRPILDGSVRYRCYHPAEVLLKEGHWCSIYSTAQFYCKPCFDFDIYIFHRPHHSKNNKQLPRIIEQLIQNKKKVLADYDDLIFGDKEIALVSSIYKNKVRSKENTIQIFKENLEALQFFENITVSTLPLSKYATFYNTKAKVTVIPNIISPSFAMMHFLLKTAWKPRKKECIGYFAGTKSHDKDILIVEEILHRVLLENENYTFIVVGPVSLPSSLSALPNVVTTGPVSYWRLPSLMSLCSFVIAPLEKSPFNSCKSRVKFLEASLSGCRLVATPIPDMKEIGPDHLIYAETPDEWYNALSSVSSYILDKDHIINNLSYINNKNLKNQIFQLTRI